MFSAPRRLAFAFLLFFALLVAVAEATHSSYQSSHARKSLKKRILRALPPRQLQDGLSDILGEWRSVVASDSALCRFSRSESPIRLRRAL
ncbi:hypothetical protein CERSUDRAFT_81071 [Gelatoporia subvermispora B]|uniref:Uncharacterized protein n=1 Tax=Ceriporiopsis subvermispora (strain B) TaxID=914234 RepID=M2R538_CERS8|nr:hypothetical protein CERSUDRAFT_81071 [Gelatoporia subvermispora B]